MKDPVLGLDQEHNIIFLNHETEKVMGMTADNLLRKNARDIAVINDLMRSLLQEEFNNPSQKENNVLKIYADNKESYFEKQFFEISFIPTGEKQAQRVGKVILLKNITPYKELDFAKTNFIANVSHEFKTPISSIKMSLQLLNNNQIGNLNEEQRHLVDCIEEDAERLLRITSELLNMTQVESGNIKLNTSSVSLEDMARQAIAATQTEANAKNIQINFHSSPQLPTVNVDRDKTIWVVKNILSNAVQYSYEFSTIHVSINQGEDYVCISVKDEGQGIEEKYLEKIFERYFRVPGTKKEGSGLGLAISKELMAAQGGRIEVRSEFGVGSEFLVYFNK